MFFKNRVPGLRRELRGVRDGELVVELRVDVVPLHLHVLVAVVPQVLVVHAECVHRLVDGDAHRVLAREAEVYRVRRGDLSDVRKAAAKSAY